MSSSIPHFDWSDRGGGLNILACHGCVTTKQRAALLESVHNYLSSRPSIRGLIVDLGDVTDVDSAGVGTLFQITTAVRQHGGRTVLAHPSHSLHHLLDAVGLTRLASVAETVEDGVEALGGHAARQ